MGLCQQSDVSDFNTLSRLVIPRDRDSTSKAPSPFLTQPVIPPLHHFFTFAPSPAFTAFHFDCCHIPLLKPFLYSETLNNFQVAWSKGYKILNIVLNVLQNLAKRHLSSLIPTCTCVNSPLTEFFVVEPFSMCAIYFWWNPDQCRE